MLALYQHSTYILVTRHLSLVTFSKEQPIETGDLERQFSNRAIAAGAAVA